MVSGIDFVTSKNARLHDTIIKQVWGNSFSQPFIAQAKGIAHMKHGVVGAADPIQPVSVAVNIGLLTA